MFTNKNYLASHNKDMSKKSHSTAKMLIRTGHLIYFEAVKNHNGLSPALLLYFDNHSPIAISKELWAEYSDVIISSNSLYNIF